MRSLSLLSCIAAAGAFVPSVATAAISLTAGGVTAVTPAAFDRTPASTPNPLTSVSASQGAGSYIFSLSSITGVATVASGTVATPSFALTITNNTGSTITGLALSGTVAQLKDNSSNLIETLTATSSGLSGITAGDYSFTSVSNNGDSSSTVNTPPLTKAYSPTASTGLSFANGSSFTLTWTDANDGGTDAMFGLSGLSINATLAPSNATPSFAGTPYAVTVDLGNRSADVAGSVAIGVTDTDASQTLNLAAGAFPVGFFGASFSPSTFTTPQTNAASTFGFTVGASVANGIYNLPITLTDNVIGSPVTVNVAVTVVPEPASLALLGGASLLVMRRRR